MVTTDGLLEAYYDCRRSKRHTASAIVYEMDYETKLIALRDRINNRVYQPGKSICFVVTRPRYREVFAASFEDRIVHHYIALRLEPLFELVFSPRTFNCRKEKGQLYGINILKQDIRDCSENYTRTCWKEYVMAIIEVQPKDPVTLRVDVIDMGLLHLLETRYVVLIEQRDNDIVIELYKK